MAARHVLPALHFALVSHAICAEHGELTHAEHEPSAAARVGAEAAAGVIAWTTSPSGSHAGHEHCEGLACRQDDDADLSRGAWQTPTTDVSSPDTRGRPRAARGGIALLAYAPKLAPPA
jgi:hypothetical protein